MNHHAIGSYDRFIRLSHLDSTTTTFGPIRSNRIRTVVIQENNAIYIAYILYRYIHHNRVHIIISQYSQVKVNYYRLFLRFCNFSPRKHSLSLIINIWLKSTLQFASTIMDKKLITISLKTNKHCIRKLKTGKLNKK